MPSSKPKAGEHLHAASHGSTFALLTLLPLAPARGSQTACRTDFHCRTKNNNSQRPHISALLATREETILFLPDEPPRGTSAQPSVPHTDICTPSKESSNDPPVPVPLSHLCLPRQDRSRTYPCPHLQVKAAQPCQDSNRSLVPNDTCPPEGSVHPGSKEREKKEKCTTIPCCGTPSAALLFSSKNEGKKEENVCTPSISWKGPSPSFSIFEGGRN
ncbi:uncharacterized protein B0I36DRAFT_346417 [Microdochium trichocladiopsis]|uniref:Uncharacterized protein n=1 Tax=Microdochium trichocladiopsis TaxID=1682393 RepID=A0A9P8YGK6_9PEZI|nr:uncharacterized protein B0I36DRAFT_346413 [Microdochium trichocladiopsis]XP_046017598.1 uncharacterized protein B0I36DRAFT_346417 [Microdochium trichocladiopsis]KAH7038468.1 hypothetical protein B0I36DRAFT_346413 [Microdochium trichocladiopsis]KAH7038477.1 hypothetical protein B0I36DRAFT_346417 [Microdochium trichocladiopsis]